MFLKNKNTLGNHTSNFMKYRYLLKELVNKNIKLQYRDSVLGVFWTFLQPLLNMIVLSLVFNNLFGKDNSKVVNYPVYLLCGRLMFEFFTKSTKKAMKSIRSHAGIIKKVYVPKYIYPVSSVLSTFVTSMVSLLVLVFVVAFFNIAKINPIDITWRVIFVLVPILIVFVLSLGVSMILATADVFFKDVENIYDVFTTLLFYLTPIVYHPDRLGFAEGSFMSYVIKLNPLGGIVGMFRACVIWGNDFIQYWDFGQMYYCIGFSVVTLIIGFVLFYKNQDKFILHI
ncbi:MAG: ABC transporter permease [Clostridia bacterium]|nr:ABC transporter permease [Clostridia bacterium]MBQ8029823.1 ABC transporter permease [Clostridia bacterium]